MSTERVHRKLAAILCADVEGYSRLMQDDPEGTLHTLTDHREVFRRFTENHEGRVVDSPGDNILIEFASAIEAVQCAVEIQRELAEKNAELADDRQMRFRIGIDLGDLLEKDDALYGDGVNISARLQSLAESGGICVSGRAYDQVVNRLTLKFEFLGKRSVKNIAHPIRVYRVLTKPVATSAVVKRKKARFGIWQRASLYIAAIIVLVVVGIGYFSYRQKSVVSDIEEPPKTIAVLPFVNLSSDPEQEYFVDGLSEELLNSLTKIQDLQVIARTSSFAFKGTGKKVQEIADELGASHVLEGSVRKAGNELRITAQLIRAADGIHLWSETYDRKLEDIFAIQEEIATAVSNELKVKLGVGGTLEKLGGTDNAEAYQYYLVALGNRGVSLSNAAMVIESLDKALKLDPEFALAWAQKAGAHSVLSGFLPLDRSASELDAALIAAQKAMELEPKLGEAYYFLGWVKDTKGKWFEAEAAFRKYLELKTELLSGDDFFIALHYMYLGYFKKANELFEQMLKNDPFSQMVRSEFLLNFTALGDIERAEEEYENGKELFGEKWVAGNIYITLARFGSGHVVDRDRILITSPILDAAKEHLDSPEKGISELRRIYASGGLSRIDIGTISLLAAYFGDFKFAMDVIKDVDYSGLWLPVYHEIRQLPRFKEFVREIGLVDYWNEFGWPDLCRPLENGDFVCD